MRNTIRLAVATAKPMETHARPRVQAFLLTTTDNANHRKNWYVMKIEMTIAINQKKFSENKSLII